ncbi:3-oxoacyl-[acyl-carrier-protein] reductase [Wickerhamomyces ciferrii]|uniref:3-oxoacyl-[acyl-carrier-protein] reductase n=1 Tax=Wickerhamomyces ciferrii (strain ATCC 14091 / BCRC 22168 / CBS 111 / JCM 3599 / NBRC 0793 / NRRL Y-1031 F-60-10) TaxID=1206466 RepID=K0KL12_WICCF|nr:3-oxoacyl-[acyl-carrier-protein] reductase [Wickerhamomyces ciferrii]CCH42852.1 3-oxoacyl-[acyl-carrier-protein] reductase [Wickerhamomyces ciferrii]
MGKVYFIAGATKGIGLQLATQLSQADSSNTVIATARNTNSSNKLNGLVSKQENVHIVKLDLSSEESINGIDEQISSLVSKTGIDVLIVNGALGDSTPFRDLDRKTYIDHYLVNVLGPIQVVNVLHKYLVKASTKQIFFTSSAAGQVSSFIPFETGAYGHTKAALNHSALQLSVHYKNEGFTVIPLHPGIVDTDLANAAFDKLPEEHAALGKTFRDQFVSPAESASHIISNIINKVTVEDSGKFFNYDGTVLPY